MTVIDCVEQAATKDDHGVFLSPQGFAQMGSEIWRHFTLYEPYDKSEKLSKEPRLIPHLKTYFRMKGRKLSDLNIDDNFQCKLNRRKCTTHNMSVLERERELIWFAFGSM